MNDKFVKTPSASFYLVAFSSQRTLQDAGYAEMARMMFELAVNEYDCLGVETARDESGFGITNSYWKDEKSIAAWKNDPRHLATQKLGKEKWYEHFEVRIAKVERAYSLDRK